MNKLIKLSLLSVGWIVGSAAIGFALIVGVIIYAFVDQTPPRPMFSGYESSIPLNGSKVVHSEVGTLTEGAFFTYDYAAYTQKYSSGVDLTQRANQGSHTYENCEDRSYIKSPPEYLRYVCDGGPIESGGDYTVVTTFYEGDLHSVQVYALINNTSMVMFIPDDMKAEFENYSGWQEYFDAMRPIELNPSEPPLGIPADY